MSEAMKAMVARGYELEAENARLEKRVADLSEKLRKAREKKRFELVKAAMQGIVSASDRWPGDVDMVEIARRSVRLADALLLALTPPGPEEEGS